MLFFSKSGAVSYIFLYKTFFLRLDPGSFIHSKTRKNGRVTQVAANSGNGAQGESLKWENQLMKSRAVRLPEIA